MIIFLKKKGNTDVLPFVCIRDIVNDLYISG